MVSDPQSCPVGESPLPPYFFPVTAEVARSWPDPFATPGWLSHCDAYARTLRESGRAWLSPRRILRALAGRPALAPPWNSLLPELRKRIDAQGTVSVLDIGGGFGDNYLMFGQALKGTVTKLDYHVVDNQESIDLGYRILPGPSVVFSTEVPDRRFDVAILIGTLQCVDDWRGLTQAVKEHADVVYIARSPVKKSGGSFMAGQAVCPAYGEQALRKVGNIGITVIGHADLAQEFADWDLVLDQFFQDYSPNFSRFPPEQRDIEYRNMMWRRR